MKLYSLNEYTIINENLDAYKKILNDKYPHLSDQEINNMLHSIFFSSDGGVTESEIFTEFIESLDESIKDIILKVGKVKSLQKKANKIKIKKAQVENQGEIQKDQVAKKIGRATDDKTKDAKEKAIKAIDDKVKTQKEILTNKESELESRASEKSGGNKFLDAYKASLKHKGEIAALDVQLQQASEKEAIEIKRAMKEKEEKAEEEKAKARAEAEAQQEAEAEAQQEAESQQEPESNSKAEEEAEAQEAIDKAKAEYDEVKDGEDEKAKLQAEIKFKQAQQKKARLDDDDDLFQGLGDDIGEIMKKINALDEIED